VEIFSGILSGNYYSNLIVIIALFSHFLSSFWGHDWLASSLFVFCVRRNILHTWSGKRTGEYGRNIFSIQELQYL